MNTIKITLATLVIAASATSAFAFDGTSGRSDRIVTEVPGATATYQAPSNEAVVPVYGWVSQGTVNDQTNLNKVHINNH